jgi:hypothetical protein
VSGTGCEPAGLQVRRRESRREGLAVLARGVDWLERGAPGGRRLSALPLCGLTSSMRELDVLWRYTHRTRADAASCRIPVDWCRKSPTNGAAPRRNALENAALVLCRLPAVKLLPELLGGAAPGRGSSGFDLDKVAPAQIFRTI